MRKSGQSTQGDREGVGEVVADGGTGDGVGVLDDDLDNDADSDTGELEGVLDDDLQTVPKIL